MFVGGTKKTWLQPRPFAYPFQNAWVAFSVCLPWEDTSIAEKDGGVPVHLAVGHLPYTAPHTGPSAISIGNTSPVTSVSRHVILRPDKEGEEHFLTSMEPGTSTGNQS